MTTDEPTSYSSSQNPPPLYASNRNVATAPSPSKGTLDTLFVYDSQSGFDDFAPLLAKAYYSHNKIAPVGDIQDLSALLGKYSTIGTLAIFAHSIPGAILLGGRARTAKDVNGELGKSGVRVTKKIVFEGCSIMKDPVDTCRMIQSIAGPNAVAMGYSYYTITQTIGFDFKGVNDVAAIEKRYKEFDSKYWLPGLPTPSEAKGTRFVHGRRWFRDVMDTTPPEDNNIRHIESYTSLNRVSISNAAEAIQVRDSYDAPVYSGDLITVSNITAVARAGP